MVSSCICQLFESLLFCPLVTGSLGSCCLPATSPKETALCGTATSTEGTPWPSEPHFLLKTISKVFSNTSPGLKLRRDWPGSLLWQRKGAFCHLFVCCCNLWSGKLWGCRENKFILFFQEGDQHQWFLNHVSFPSVSKSHRSLCHQPTLLFD